MNWTYWLMFLLPNVVASISPELRQELITFAKNFKAAAQKTKNPWDDLASAILSWLLGINV